MDNRTGQIRQLTYEQWKELPDDEKRFYTRMDPPNQPTSKQERLMNVGRNEKCPCGSGNKFKKCCLGKTTRNGFRD